MNIDDNNKMVEIIKENFGKKKINFLNISSYILKELIPYIKNCFKDNANNINFLEGLTPLMIYNFEKTINYYNQMINNDIINCQNKILDDMVEVDELKKQQKSLKLKNKILKTNNNDLENKIAELTKKMEKMTKEIEKFKIDIGEKMENKDNEILDIKKKMKKKDEDIKEKMKEKDNEILDIKEKMKEKDNDLFNIKTELKIAKQSIKNLERDYEEIHSFRNVIMCQDFSNKLIIKETSQKNLELKIHNRKLRLINSLLDSQISKLTTENCDLKNKILKESNLVDKGAKENIELAEMRLKINELNDVKKELEKEIEDAKQEKCELNIQNKNINFRRYIENMNYNEFKERAKYFISINQKIIRDLELDINKKNARIEQLEKNSRKDSC